MIEAAELEHSLETYAASLSVARPKIRTHEHRNSARSARTTNRRAVGARPAVGKVSLRISWSISLSRSERERAITKQIQDDQTHSPERGIFPAAAFVREQPAVGSMNKNDRAKHFDRQRQRYPRDIDPENECDSAEQLECDSAVGHNRW